MNGDENVYPCNCFAYTKYQTFRKQYTMKCRALTKMYCMNGGKCAFYKSKEQYDAEREKYGGEK